MTKITHQPQTTDIKQEIRQLREAARKIASTKETARKFLISTGMYTTAGQLKPQFR